MAQLLGKSSMGNFVESLRENEQNGNDLARLVQIPGKVVGGDDEL